MKKTFLLWDNSSEHKTEIHFYKPKNKKSDVAIVIFAGGAYAFRSAHEGVGYAEFLSENGYNAFVVDYRVAPDYFPLPLLDARRAVRFVRANAEKFCVDKNKVLVMGSSAGGHLAALVSTYTQKIDGECADNIDKENFLPNGQILCYPVIASDESIAHIDSYKHLLGTNFDKKELFSPELLVNQTTPPAYIWHTSEDDCVNVINSYRYAASLREFLIPCEMHIFPYGPHGAGLARQFPHITRWKEWLLEWLQTYY